MPQVELPWRHFLDSPEVTFEALAAEAMEVARVGTGFGKTPLFDRLAYWFLARELRLAHRIASFAGKPRLYVYWRLGVLHYGIWLFAPCAVIAMVRVLLVPSGGDTAPDLLYTLAVLWVLTGVIAGLFTMTMLGDTESILIAAQRYRITRLAFEAALRSEQGVDGWRLVRYPGGGWVLTYHDPGSLD